MDNPTIATALVGILLLAGCAGSTSGPDPELFGTNTGGTIKPNVIRQEGSSTVLPLAEVWAEEFGKARGIQFSVAGGGSGRGASGLCAGELDIGDLSRHLKASEIEACKAKGIDAKEWKVAYDALTVAVSNQNTFVHDLTVAQLAHLFREKDPALRWSDVDPTFPDAPVRLCYPDSDSGTYEYFNEAVLEKGKPRTGSGVQQSPEDNVIVNCLTGDLGAIGYMGMAYVESNLRSIRPVKVGGVEPTPQHVIDGTYKPLSSFVYMATNRVPKNNLLSDYLHYVLSPEGGQRLVAQVGYVPLDAATRQAMLDQLGA
jgi:phosphate transport system substrate-binding protein